MQEFIPMAKDFAQNHTLMVLAWVMVFFTVIYTFIKDFTSKVKVVTNAEAVSLMNNQDAVVVDLRSIDEFAHGHIINSLNILPAEIKKNSVGKINQHKDTPVILVCATGMSASTSADLLVKQGFNQVYTLKEGISGWRAANLPLIKK
ncbi:rhodanese-like domain-containing protein [Pasteurella canis]|uniref:rhodanese-like domain-containing protein n=1 Tax=Pasteurella canis TaxID=753 RepID=UPI001D12C374|nr:rhodanese-like domain-containing protein [Pasteurella canis]UDW83478.1 rhodanese-like domain-containing protein [Pasteurella canis]